MPIRSRNTTQPDEGLTTECVHNCIGKIRIERNRAKFVTGLDERFMINSSH